MSRFAHVAARIKTPSFASEMKHARELKVGIAIIVAAVLFFVGIRYFNDVPILRGTYDLSTDFENAQGLTAGNDVHVRGVKVGSVESVRLNEETNRVRVLFNVDRSVPVPEGTTTELAGIAALSGVRINLILGPSTRPDLEPGSYVPSAEARSDLMERAPVLVDRAEEVLLAVAQTFARMDTMLLAAEPELTRTLQAARGASDALEYTLRSQQGRFATTVENLEVFSEDLRSITHDNRDSLHLLISRMNVSFSRLNDNLTDLQGATASLNTILSEVQSGEGTVGRLLADPALYERLDSTLSRINNLVTDFQKEPARYLREMRLIDIF